MTSVTDALKQRVSTRAFLDKPVSQDLLAEIIEVATRAPSGGNTQPWHLYILTGEPRDSLVKSMKDPKNLTGSKVEYEVYPSKKVEPKKYPERKRTVAFDMYKLMGVDWNNPAQRNAALAKNWEFFGAPVGIIVTVDRVSDRNAWGHTGMLIHSIALLAQERGLGTCFQEAWGNLDIVPKTLDIPDSETVWCAIALGYPDPSAPVNSLKTAREPLNGFVQWHGFERAKL